MDDAVTIGTSLGSELVNILLTVWKSISIFFVSNIYCLAIAFDVVVYTDSPILHYVSITDRKLTRHKNTSNHHTQLDCVN